MAQARRGCDRAKAQTVGVNQADCRQEFPVSEIGMLHGVLEGLHRI